MNRWSLEELVKRDPENFLILLQQIIRKTREVQEHCQYELVAPLAIMFSSTLLQTPFCPPDAELLEEAMQVFRRFLTWPEPYCSVCRDLLSTLQQELRAPGISFNRLVREEQGLNTPGFHSKTVREGGNDKVPVSEFQAAGPSVPPCSLDGEPHRAVELGQTRFLQNSQK
ncbi:unnamed protein product [Arctogadus glacialis]